MHDPRQSRPQVSANVRLHEKDMTLEVAEALLVMSQVPREALPVVATDLLAAGMDTPALRRLAGLLESELDEADVCFRQVLFELGRQPLSLPEAIRRIAVDLAGKVLSGQVRKRDAAGIGAGYARALDYEPTFMPLYLADDEYDCPFHGPSLADKDVLRWAEATSDPASRHAVEQPD